MKKIPLPIFIIPFALLSALSVTQFLAYPLKMFYSTTFLPGLIFSIGIYWYVQKQNIDISKKFIIKSTLIYFSAYSMGYFAGVVTWGLLATFVAVLVGTPLFFKLILNTTGVNNKEEKVRGWVISVLMSILFGIAAFILATLETDFLKFWGDVQSGYPLEAYDGEIFGSVMIGTQILIFAWQIIMSFVIARIINIRNKNK